MTCGFNSPATPIERVKGLDSDTFVRDYLEPGRPVVVCGAMDDWPATGSWTFDYLRARCADHILPIRYFKEGARDGLDFSVKNMRLSEYFDIICTDHPERDRYYIATELVAEVFPEVASEIGRPSFVPVNERTRELDHPTVWAGRDNFTQLHYHPGSEVISSQVLGSKHFALFPPSETRYMYSNPWWVKRFNWSRVNAFRYEEMRDSYPDLDKARRFECRLQPGEQIYIPPYWWHSVDSAGPAILITSFWKSDKRMPLRSAQGFGTAFWPWMRKLKTLVLRRSHTHA